MGLDRAALQLAFRARLKTVVFATTGSASLGATTQGYTRSTGSFVTDGFVPGMETVGSGFASAVNNAAKVVTEVAPLLLKVDGAVVNSEAGSRSLTVGMPRTLVLTNTEGNPVPGSPYWEDSLAPAPPSLRTMPADGGWISELGLYVVRLYGVFKVGDLAIRKEADGILALFKINTLIPTTDGSKVVVPGTGPWAGEVMQDEPGWAVCTVKIPYWAQYTN